MHVSNKIRQLIYVFVRLNLHTYMTGWNHLPLWQNNVSTCVIHLKKCLKIILFLSSCICEKVVKGLLERNFCKLGDECIRLASFSAQSAKSFLRKPLCPGTHETVRWRPWKDISCKIHLTVGWSDREWYLGGGSGEIDMCASGLFCTKFNSKQLLFKAFFDVMRIFGSVESYIECNLPFRPCPHKRIERVSECIT